MVEAVSNASRCARCGAAFRCGIGDAGGCWCAQLPPAPLERLDAGAGCLCRACLALLVASAAGTGTAWPVADACATAQPPRAGGAQRS